MQNLERFKKQLDEERTKLEGELTTLGRRDPGDVAGWVLTPPTIDIMEADENEVADRVEEIHIDQIVLDELEARYRLVLHAQKRAEEGTYGVCEVGGEPIEEDRLGANPAARTCKKHMGEESTLVL